MTRSCGRECRRDECSRFWSSNGRSSWVGEDKRGSWSCRRRAHIGGSASVSRSDRRADKEYEEPRTLVEHALVRIDSQLHTRSPLAALDFLPVRRARRTWAGERDGLSARYTLEAAMRTTYAQRGEAAGADATEAAAG